MCHRDYSNPKGNEVAIFKDRIEIYNPGNFPEEIEPEDFFSGKEHSVLRNPLIAETMYKSKDIERWGSGIKRIHEECAAAGIAVEFDRLKTGFAVVFYRPEMENDEGLVERLVEGLVESQRKILDFISDNPHISKKELSDKIGISTTAIDKNITQLKKKGFLKRIGPAKGGCWKVSI